jgi:hypothetical protein
MAIVVAGCGGAPSSPSPVGEPPPPPPGLLFACYLGIGDCSSVMEGQRVSFTITRSQGLTVRSAMVDFGDGSPTETLSWSDPVNALSAVHVYQRRGIFTARVTSVDSSGREWSPSLTVTVGSVVSLAMTAEALGSLQASATAVVSGATATRFEWTFDPQASPVVTSVPRAVFTYAAPGWKDLSLLVTVDDGRVFRASGSVVVE